MHDNSVEITRAIGLLIVLCTLVGFIYICEWFFRSIFGPREAPLEPLDEAQEWAHAKSLVSQPRPRPDGSWERGRIVWEACDAPVDPVDEIHFPTDPEHLRGCKRCQRTIREQRRMPHATN